ncbi:MAG TPA: GspMb/PilO family protein [Burkholderiales bacterium]|nr:GspMb/PilO family protein [Burkholderiales bacterium]
MDAALRLALWRLQRVVRAMNWSALAGVALAIFAAGFFFANVMPLRSEVTVLRERLKLLEAQPENQAPVEEPLRADAQLAAFYGKLQSAPQAPEVVHRLHAAARSAGLVLDRGEYRPLPDPSGKLVRYQIVLPVKGSYPQVRRFLAQAMRDMPGLALDGIGFQRDKGGPTTIEAQLRLTVFLRAAI